MSLAKPASADASRGCRGSATNTPVPKPTASASTPTRIATNAAMARGLSVGWTAPDEALSATGRRGLALRRGGRLGPGGGLTGRAAGARFDAGGPGEAADELGDPLVTGLVELELEAPRLQRDRLVQARVRAHQREVLAADLLGQRVDLVLRQIGVVRHPDRAVLHAVDRLLLRDLRVVDVALAVLPAEVVVAADRRGLLVRLLAGHVVASEIIRVALAEALQAVDLLRPPLAERLAGIANAVHAIPDDAGRDDGDDRAEGDHAPRQRRLDRLDGLAARTPGALAGALTGGLPAGLAGRARAGLRRHGNLSDDQGILGPS